MLFVVDASGSMAARQRMSAVKTAVLSLLLDAYQRRDKVGMITFRGRGRRPRPAADLVGRGGGGAAAPSCRTGGRTPLAAGLLRAAERAARRSGCATRAPPAARHRHRRPGHRAAPATRRRAARRACSPGRRAVVVDCEAGPVRLGLAGALAARARRATASRSDELGRVVRSRPQPSQHRKAA